MSIALKPGSRLFSTVCSTEMIVIKAPPGEIQLMIGDAAPADDSAGRPSPGRTAAGHDGGTKLGKRYVDESGDLELLCVKGGPGLPAVDGRLLQVKDAKPLPASD